MDLINQTGFVHIKDVLSLHKMSKEKSIVQRAIRLRTEKKTKSKRKTFRLITKIPTIIVSSPIIQEQANRLHVRGGGEGAEKVGQVLGGRQGGC